VKKKRRRSRLSPLLSLWPLVLTVLLLAMTFGWFWSVSREVVFSRKPLPVPVAAKAKK